MLFCVHLKYANDVSHRQVLLFAVFVVRGKPYSARHVGSVLFPDGRHGHGGCTCAARAFKPVLAFLWTVVSG